ncbi:MULTISPECIES: hypothetical protein [Bacillaceae]|uniref:Uncharacterized protein n=1 Tax=Bacillus salipaludis TaxID=2547811 RepID=A0A4R5VY20_9BACI|nr:MULTISPECIES: hypothetical protein [Bacillaceae]MBI0576868.1 hypothetical protein [Neobacillus cucumis]MDQ6597189.1 hypothetical protein [Bacillus salipaludis]TDK63362.1 hypothetical protein E2K98_07930 [Bacillus salipaludis]
MPSVINLGVLNVNTPQQNANVSIGESIITGMDSNRKFNQGFGSTFGFFNVLTLNVANNLDNLDGIDGVIFDQDIKPNFGANI